EAAEDPSYGASVVAVGADRSGAAGLERAEAAGLPTFVCRLGEFDSREEWDGALTRAVGRFEPDLVVLAGFLKLVGGAFLDRFGDAVVNTHPALCPSFP